MKHTKDTKWEKRLKEILIYQDHHFKERDIKRLIKSTLEEYTEEVEKVIENNVETNCTLDEDYVKRDLRQALHKLNAKFNILQGE